MQDKGRFALVICGKTNNAALYLNDHLLYAHAPKCARKQETSQESHDFASLPLHSDHTFLKPFQESRMDEKLMRST